MTKDDENHVMHLADGITWTAITKHAQACPLAATQMEPRLRAVEITVARLIGFMLGTGTLGGTIGAAITKLLSP
jgi:hypothetical protein